MHLGSARSSGQSTPARPRRFIARLANVVIERLSMDNYRRDA